MLPASLTNISSVASKPVVNSVWPDITLLLSIEPSTEFAAIVVAIEVVPEPVISPVNVIVWLPVIYPWPVTKVCMSSAVAKFVPPSTIASVVIVVLTKPVTWPLLSKVKSCKNVKPELSAEVAADMLGWADAIVKFGYAPVTVILSPSAIAS